MRLIVFAGTSEGHALARFLSENQIPAQVHVATEYGELTLEPMQYITVEQGRLDNAQMRAIFTADSLVIDATHPYADKVTDNIRAACQSSGCQYLRLIRPRIAVDNQAVITVPDAAHAAEYINTVTGAVLLTTGSKELEAFTAVEHFAQRLYPRVLPTAQVLQKCTELGFAGKNIMAMQGPFSYEMNTAMLRQIHAKFLVTKDTGAAGGFADKLKAAQDTGVTVILISRPTEESGLTLAQIQQRLCPERQEKNTLQSVRRFPLFVSLQDKLCVVVGAGKIAARRTAVLKRFGAKVRVIAPDSPGNMAIDCVRAYQSGDLTGAFIAVAATNSRKVNQKVAQEAQKAQILCSVADCAAQSTFFFPAVCTGGSLTAGVVSDGAHHAVTARAAARIRKILEEDGI